MAERALTPTMLQEMLAEETAHVMLMLVKISHTDLTEDIRVVANTENITYDGHEWIGLMFEIALPSDDEDRIPVTSLKVDNVDREIVAAIRSISSPPDIELTVVRVDELDVVTKEIGPLSFRLNDADWDALYVQASLGYEADYLNEPAIKDRFDPTIFPGLFK